jgi:hypothetical protein
MMFIDLLDDDVQRDRNTWNTIQDQNWIFTGEHENWTWKLNNEFESNKIIEWNTEQKSNKDE